MMLDVFKSIELIQVILFVPLVSGLLLMLLKSARIAAWMNLACTFTTAAAIGMIVQRVIQKGPILKLPLMIDQLSCIFLLIIGFLGCTAAMFSIRYLETEYRWSRIPEDRIPRYYGLFQLFLLTMTSVVVFENLGMIWVAVEATTLVTALLVAFNANRSALEAAWKYIMVCSVGIAMALLGAIFLYYAQVQAGMQESQALSWLELRGIAKNLDPQIIKLAAVFTVIGYGAKAGLAPMHTWLPDAHSQAPSPISGLLSGGLLSCAMYALSRNLSIYFMIPEVRILTSELLTAFGLLSLVVAVPFLLLQHDIKRLLAYSSVENMGLVALAFSAVSSLGSYGALFQVINHALIKSALFYAAGMLVLEYHTKQILRIRGLIQSSPVAAGLFITAVFAVSGLPPFSMFLSKLLIIQSLFQQDKFIPAVSALLLLVGVFTGLLYYAMRISLGHASVGHSEWKPGLLFLLPVLISLLAVAGMGVAVPSWLDGLLKQAAAIIAGGGA